MSSSLLRQQELCQIAIQLLLVYLQWRSSQGRLFQGRQQFRKYFVSSQKPLIKIFLRTCALTLCGWLTAQSYNPSSTELSYSTGTECQKCVIKHIYDTGRARNTCTLLWGKVLAPGSKSPCPREPSGRSGSVAECNNSHFGATAQKSCCW